MWATPVDIALKYIYKICFTFEDPELWGDPSAELLGVWLVTTLGLSMEKSIMRDGNGKWVNKQIIIQLHRTKLFWQNYKKRLVWRIYRIQQHSLLKCCSVLKWTLGEHSGGSVVWDACHVNCSNPGSNVDRDLCCIWLPSPYTRSSALSTALSNNSKMP